MVPNLELLELKIVEYATKSLNKFANEHKEEKFYGFGFDIDSNYGNILLCFNTEEDFKKTSQRYIKKWQYTEKDLKDLKLNFGDWKYQGFNLDYKEWEPWYKYEREIENYILNNYEKEELEREREEFPNKFIISCTHALLKLKQSEVFEQFQKEDNFFIQIMDHDENEDEAQIRFEEIRKKFY